MRINTTLALFFLLVVAVPCGACSVLLISRGQGAMPVLLIGALSVLVALLLAWLVSKLFTKPIRTLTALVGNMASGHFDEHADDLTFRAVREYEELATTVAMLTSVLGETHLRLEQQVDECTRELNATHQQLATSQDETERLNTVMIDRELKMIELKTKLREVRLRLGEDV